MTIPFSGIITPQSMSFTTPDGKVHNVTLDHQNYDAIKETIKALQKALSSDQSEEAAEHHNKLSELVNIAKVIEDAGHGRVLVKDGVVYYDGEAIHNAVTNRILWGLKEGFDMGAYLNFLDDLMLNPSKRAVDEVYGFIEANNMGIMEDGRILAYKRVTGDFRDIYTGKFDNTPGQIVTMRRNKVDDNKQVTCSHGLHVCAQSYLPHYGVGRGNTIVVVAVWPRNFVSIPVDYANAKARVCEYEVLSQYEGEDVDDLLAYKSVWSESDFDDAYDDEDGYDEPENEWTTFIDEDESEDAGINEADESYAPMSIQEDFFVTAPEKKVGSLTKEEVIAFLNAKLPELAREKEETLEVPNETEQTKTSTVDAAVAASLRLLAAEKLKKD